MKKTEINLFANPNLLVGFILILLVTVSSLASPYFLTSFNLQSLMRSIAFVGMVAVAQSLLLLVGELDLSVGKIATLSGILGGLLMTKAGFNPYLSFVMGVSAGMVFGLINGLLVTKLRLNSLVVTIGMQGVYGGITLVITKGKAVTKIPDVIFFLGKGNIAGIPIPFYLALLVTLMAMVIVKKTKTGRYIYAIGNSRSAAKLLGINVKKIEIQIFAMVGLISAFAGMLYVARLGSAQATIGSSWPMNSIAASVIGGVMLKGGIGNPGGAFLGACIIAVISNLIVLLGVNIYWQEAVGGVIVVLAIALPSLLELIRERRRFRKN